MSEAQTWRNFIKVNTVKKKIKPIFNARPKSCFSVADNIKFIDLISANTSIVDPNLKFPKKEQNSLWDAIGEQLNKSGSQCRKRWRQLRSIYRHNKGKSPSHTHRQYYLMSSLRKFDAFLIAKPDLTKKQTSNAPKIQKFYELSDGTLSSSTSAADTDIVKIEEDTSTEIVRKKNIKEDKTPTIIVKEEDDSVSIDNTWLNNSSAVQNDGSLVVLVDEDNIIKNVNKGEMEICANDVSTFTEYAQTVLRALPPQLRVLAKRDLFEVLHKYEVVNIGEV